MKRIFLFLVSTVVGSFLIFACGGSATLAVSSLSPDGGTTAGGTQVTISGRGFMSDTTVKFGDNSATIVSIASSTTMVVTAPAATSGATGSVNVVVTQGSNTSTLANGYKYASDLFVSNFDSADVVVFDVNRQTPSITSSLTKSTGGTGPFALDVDTDHGILFVANKNSSTISSFLYVITSGAIALTAATGSPFSAGGTYPVSIAADTTADLVFTANYNSNDVSSFQYAPTTGVLTFVEAQAGENIRGPRDVAVDEVRRLAFVPNSSVNTVSVFTYTTAGDLTEITPSTAAGGTTPSAIVIDNSIPAIFVANYGSATVTVFTYNSLTGVLTSAGSGNCSGNGPIDLAIDTTNKILFVAQSTSNTVGAFTYTSSGALTQVSTTGTSSGGTNPWALALDTDKKYLYVANAGSADIQIMTYTTAGVLTASGSPASVGGLNPTSIFLAP